MISRCRKKIEMNEAYEGMLCPSKPLESFGLPHEREYKKTTKNRKRGPCPKSPSTRGRQNRASTDQATQPPCWTFKHYVLMNIMKISRARTLRTSLTTWTRVTGPISPDTKLSFFTKLSIRQNKADSSAGSQSHMDYKQHQRNVGMKNAEFIADSLRL